MRLLKAAGALSIVLVANPALTAFDQMAIQEVFLGPPSDYEIFGVSFDQRKQYVMLKMTNAGQISVSGTSLRVEGASGNLLGSFGAFTADVGNGGAPCSYPGCPSVLIGTAAADGLFLFSFDKDVDGQVGRVLVPLLGGRVCYVSGSSVVDCVAWGNFNCTLPNCSLPNGPRTGDVSANGCDLNFGTPVPVPQAGPFGRILQRIAFSCGSKDNANDFTLAFPHAVNNAGANDNVDTDGDGLIDGLDCDDTPGSGTAYLWDIGANLANLRLRLIRVPGPTVEISYSQEETSGTAVSYDVATFCGTPQWTCLSGGESAGSTVDPILDPTVRLCFYLARGKTSPNCGGTGNYGSPLNPPADPCVGPP